MRVELPSRPTHAIKYRNNWDGEGDTDWSLAVKVDGQFYFWDFGHKYGAPVIEHEDDEILESWVLKEEPCV